LRQTVPYINHLFREELVLHHNSSLSVFPTLAEYQL